MKKLTIVIAGISLLAACYSRKPTQAINPPPPIAKPTVISVEGTYEELNVKQKADGVPQYVGRIFIRKKNGIAVLLETHEKGIRPPVEIAQFRGKRVIVKGEKFDKNCTAWGDGIQASIIGPCIRRIASISLVKQ